MADQNVTKGFSKAGLLGLYLIGSQNVTPLIVGGLYAKFPVLGEAFWFQTVVFSSAGMATFIMWISWRNFVNLVTDIIRAKNQAFKEWKDAGKE